MQVAAIDYHLCFRSQGLPPISRCPVARRLWPVGFYHKPRLTVGSGLNSTVVARQLPHPAAVQWNPGWNCPLPCWLAGARAVAHYLTELEGSQAEDSPAKADRQNSVEISADEFLVSALPRIPGFRFRMV